jgi:hypothetical protein
MEAPGRVTLRAMAATAAALHRFRLALLGFAAVAGVWFGVELLRPQADSPRSLLALTLLLWSVLGLGTGLTLPRLPSPVAAEDRLAIRLRKRLTLAGYAVVALGMLVLGGFTLVLTLRALELYFG